MLLLAAVLVFFPARLCVLYRTVYTDYGALPDKKDWEAWSSPFPMFQHLLPTDSAASSAKPVCRVRGALLNKIESIHPKCQLAEEHCTALHCNGPCWPQLTHGYRCLPATQALKPRSATGGPRPPSSRKLVRAALLYHGKFLRFSFLVCPWMLQVRISFRSSRRPQIHRIARRQHVSISAPLASRFSYRFEVQSRQFHLFKQPNRVVSTGLAPLSAIPLRHSARP
jgi:hypothetical protein